MTSHENSGNARGSLSSVGSDSPNPCNDNDGKFYSHIKRMEIHESQSFGGCVYICLTFGAEKKTLRAENKKKMNPRSNHDFNLFKNDTEFQHLFKFELHLFGVRIFFFFFALPNCMQSNFFPWYLEPFEFDIAYEMKAEKTNYFKCKFFFLLHFTFFTAIAQNQKALSFQKIHIGFFSFISLRIVNSGLRQIKKKQKKNGKILSSSSFGTRTKRKKWMEKKMQSKKRH